MPKKNEIRPGTIGHRIRMLREDLDLSLDAFSKLVNSNKNTVSMIESGKQELKVSQLQDFAQALQTSVYYLLTGIHDENMLISQDLGLSDFSILKLREYKAEVDEDTAEQDEIIVRNKYSIVIDVLLHNPELINSLYSYIVREDFRTLTAKVFEDPEDGFYDLESFKVKDILRFPFEDLERVYRLKLMDDMKLLRDSFFEERERIHKEDMEYSKRLYEERMKFYHQQSIEVEEEKQREQQMIDEEDNEDGIS